MPAVRSATTCATSHRSQFPLRPALTTFAIAIAATLISISALAQPLKRSASRPNVEESVGQLIVKFRPDVVQTFSVASGRARASELARKSGLAIAYRRPMSGLAHVYSLPQEMTHVEAYALAKRLELSDPSIEYAEPDSIHKAFAAPNDPAFATAQWHYLAPNGAASLLGGINAAPAWNISRGQGVIVAVLDTGIVLHPDLAANVIQGYDFISDPSISNDGNGRDADPSDPGDGYPADYCSLGALARSSSWHGTHVAGTVAAVTNNGVGVAGVAYEARVLNVRVLGRCGGLTSDIADGIAWSAGLTVPGVPRNTNVAKVINLSLGGGGACSRTYQAAVQAATAAGSLVIAATGNDALGQIASPANCAGVLAVTSHTFQGDSADYANVGPHTDISAPGGGACSMPDSGGFTCLTRGNVSERYVWSTLDSGTTVPVASTYSGRTGTSMATPHVAGVAALLLSRMPTLSVSEVSFLVTNSARSFPSGTFCLLFSSSPCGAGMLDAKAALDLLSALTPSLVLTVPTVVAGGTSTSLSTTATSRNGGSSLFKYIWSQTSGPPVFLHNAETANASFVAPNPGGIHTFKVTVVDGNGYSVSQTASMQTNNAPLIDAIKAQSAEAGSILRFRVSASDPEDDQLILIATELPPGSSFDATNGDFNWTNAGPAGNYALTVVANDGTVNSVATTVNIAVTASIAAPSSSSAVAPSGGGGSITWGLIGALLLASRMRGALSNLDKKRNPSWTFSSSSVVRTSVLPLLWE